MKIGNVNTVIDTESTVRVSELLYILNSQIRSYNECSEEFFELNAIIEHRNVLGQYDYDISEMVGRLVQANAKRKVYQESIDSMCELLGFDYVEKIVHTEFCDEIDGYFKYVEYLEIRRMC